MLCCSRGPFTGSFFDGMLALYVPTYRCPAKSSMRHAWSFRLWPNPASRPLSGYFHSEPPPADGTARGDPTTSSQVSSGLMRMTSVKVAVPTYKRPRNSCMLTTDLLGFAVSPAPLGTTGTIVYG